MCKSVYTLQLKELDDTKQNKDNSADDEFTVYHLLKNSMINNKAFCTLQIKVGPEIKCEI